MAKRSETLNYVFIGLIVITMVLIPLLFLTSSPVQTRKVKLYFSYNQAQNLKAEIREIKVDNIYRQTIEELIKGPTEEELTMTIPQGTKLIDLKLENKVLKLNFNSKFRKNHWGGSTGETMTIYSIVNTMTQFPEVNSVLFLLEGEKIETLVGHVGLEDPIPPNYKLIMD
ncbi:MULTISPECIES: GerMN domain-containing protein [unclassified Candidatus Frackibacter]|uniref:GerMN domain-containing protein n=1 Tax=unclassified Candidatus Frackibacter TaxID=2648818 RepID=UPI0007926CBC|nr:MULTISPECIES: GerMN domain-containing protein [unclassified Candidatus Frackibacter]KXS41283.1 MAG: lipoprotein [Candidatus Frackibacter sp. T328-2]SDC15472.1 Sporulation and spore germination [Candidatus Frackibacter sp. WG11]SEM46190.1 Sporulation and spore germination [Candidatus Frackibacter sp. WG12]SFL48266.1 Sporulation and spore germination [Candidatus Frackibacter sp. WG13]